MTIERGYALIASLDPLEEGRIYEHPVHLKLLPWFTTEEPPSRLVDVIAMSIEKISRFEIVGEAEAGLSHNGEHRARVIGERAFLAGIHHQLLEDVQVLTPQFDKPEYIDSNYLPHVTPQVSGVRWIRRGQVANVNQLHLVSAVANSHNSGVVTKSLPLREA